jgi:hypothetical protein
MSAWSRVSAGCHGRSVKILRRLAIIVCLLAMASPARAGWTTTDGYYVFSHTGYNYAPSMIATFGLQQFWWCGEGVISGTNQKSDVIYQRTYNVLTRKWSAITQVLSPTPGAWDGQFTCDPSVIQGVFLNPANNNIYTYAMYYTASNQPDGTANQIGVAFSNDGISWTKYAGNPIINPLYSATGKYGAGQPATYNGNELAGIWLFDTDDTTMLGNRIWVQYTMDGIHFDTPTLISNISSDGRTIGTNADFAYDWATGTFYMLAELNSRPGDREVYEFGLFKMSDKTFQDDTAVWQNLGDVNSSLTGFYLNHSPGFLRDGWGNLTEFMPNVNFYFTGGTNDPSTWNLSYATWNASPASLALNRYFDRKLGHWTTTGFVPSGYTFESTLGYLFMAQHTGTVALYGCQSGNVQFVTTDSTCGGQSPLGIVGWIYSSLQGATHPLFLCTTASGDNFVSPSSGCEGQTTKLNGQPLGYALTSPQ